MQSDFKKRLKILGAIGVAFAAIEVLGVVLACYLRCNAVSDEDASLEDAKKANRNYS